MVVALLILPAINFVCARTGGPIQLYYNKSFHFALRSCGSPRPTFSIFCGSANGPFLERLGGGPSIYPVVRLGPCQKPITGEQYRRAPLWRPGFLVSHAGPTSGLTLNMFVSSLEGDIGEPTSSRTPGKGIFLSDGFRKSGFFRAEFPSSFIPTWRATATLGMSIPLDLSLLVDC